MVEAVTTKFRCLPLLLALLFLPSAVFAHRDDQYLQATLVAIEPSGVRLQINLTPGVAVAEQVIAPIDRDRDGTISAQEAAAYAELLKRDLTLRMDGRKLELKLTASEFVPPAELRTGSGIIQMEFSAILGPLAAGPHRLTLENRHLTKMSVYLINAARPRFATVEITRQKRNDNQSAGEIEFTFHPLRPKVAASAGPLKFGDENIRFGIPDCSLFPGLLSGQANTAKNSLGGRFSRGVDSKTSGSVRQPKMCALENLAARSVVLRPHCGEFDFVR